MNQLGKELASPNEQTDNASLLEDVSDEELTNAKEGKVAFSENTGVVNGDVSAGGIAGSMSCVFRIYQEDDILNPQTTGTKSLNFAYKAKAIIYQSYNKGDISTQKNCVGGIVGEADLGTVYGCQNYGDIKSDDGDYAGGIAGSSLSTVRLSYALSEISGKNYVGGIAGSGENIENCYAFVRIDSGGEHLGSIAGAGDGKVTDNYFVGNQWNGIDGISYAGKAVPQAYSDFVAAKGIPTEFTNLKLRFLADGKEIAVIPFQYGKALSTEMLPKITPKTGYSAKWPDIDFNHLTFNETLKAEYDQLITAIASKQTRGKPARPILLAESSFEKGSSITLSKTDTKSQTLSVKGQNDLESWTVKVNGLYDGNTKEIKYRYLVPETSGKIHIWIKTVSGWKEAAYQTDGSYLTFTMEPQAVFAVTMQPNIFLNYLAIWIVLAGLLICVAVLFVSYRRGKLTPVQAYFRRLFKKQANVRDMKTLQSGASWEARKQTAICYSFREHIAVCCQHPVPGRSEAALRIYEELPLFRVQAKSRLFLSIQRRLRMKDRYLREYIPVTSRKKQFRIWNSIEHFSDILPYAEKLCHFHRGKSLSLISPSILLMPVLNR